MNKRDISDRMAKELNVRKFEAYQFIDFLIEVMAENLTKGHKVMISNFGTFKVLNRHKKKVLNPNNQESMVIPPKKVVKFFPSKNLKKLLK
jgi:nucleoid DNA-binding protein